MKIDWGCPTAKKESSCALVLPYFGGWVICLWLSDGSKRCGWLDLESGDTDHRHRALPKQSRARHEKAMLCRTVTDIVNGDMRYSLSKQQKKRSAEKAGSD